MACRTWPPPAPPPAFPPARTWSRSRRRPRRPRAGPRSARRIRRPPRLRSRVRAEPEDRPSVRPIRRRRRAARAVGDSARDPWAARRLSSRVRASSLCSIRPPAVGPESVGQNDVGASVDERLMQALDPVGMLGVPEFGESPEVRPMAKRLVPVAPSASSGRPSARRDCNMSGSLGRRGRIFPLYLACRQPSARFRSGLARWCLRAMAWGVGKERFRCERRGSGSELDRGCLRIRRTRRPSERLSSWACRLASAPDGRAIFVESIRGCFSSKALKPRAKFTAQGRAERLIGSPMLHALRSLALLLILLAGSAGAAETKPFAREDMASDAVRLTETLRLATAAIGAEVKGKAPQQLLGEAARAVAGGDFADRREARRRSDHRRAQGPGQLARLRRDRCRGR